MAIKPIDAHPDSHLSEKEFSEIIETSPYTEEYKEICFTVWYGASKPRGKELVDILPDDKYGRKPPLRLLYKWQRQEWNERAKNLDIKTRESLDALIITKRVEMFERHAEAGAQLADMGLDYFEEKGITTDTAAIRAIKEGTDLERKSAGISELLKKFSTMSDKQLQSRARELLAADEDINIIEAEFEESKPEEEE